MEIFLFKVKDYTTVLAGQKYEDGFFVQRGDGAKYEYENYRIEWSKPYLQTIHNKDYMKIHKVMDSIQADCLEPHKITKHLSALHQILYESTYNPERYVK